MAKYELYDPDAPEMHMDDETAYIEILKCENIADGALNSGKLSREGASDIYFGLLHECDMRGFKNDFKRILSKIDTRSYNPFNSKHPKVVMMARLRLRMMGVIDQN